VKETLYRELSQFWPPVARPVSVLLLTNSIPVSALWVSAAFGCFLMILESCPLADRVAAWMRPLGVRLKLDVSEKGLPSQREGMAPLSSHPSNSHTKFHNTTNLARHCTVIERFPLPMICFSKARAS